jgi:hypothetical protein
VSSGVERASRHPDDPTDLAGSLERAHGGTSYLARRAGDGDGQAIGCLARGHERTLTGKRE